MSTVVHVVDKSYQPTDQIQQALPVPVNTDNRREVIQTVKGNIQQQVKGTIDSTIEKLANHGVDTQQLEQDVRRTNNSSLPQYKKDAYNAQRVGTAYLANGEQIRAHNHMNQSVWGSRPIPPEERR